MAKQSTVSVPVGIVKKLKDKPGGINPIVDELRQKHLIQANYDGNCLELQGPYDEILDIANEFLHFKVDMASAQMKTLGGEGTVAWTYRGNQVEHIRHLLDAEWKDLLKVKSVKEAQPNADSLVVTCSYSDYATVNGMLKDLNTKIKKCKERTVKVDPKDKQSAKLFAQKEKVQNKFYSCFNEDKKDKNKGEIRFYGRSEKDCKEGLSQWETSIQGNKKHPSNATDEEVIGISKTPRKHTPEVQPSNDTPITMDSIRVETKPGQEKNASTKNMSKSMDEVPDVKPSVSGSFSSSKSQKNETSMTKTYKSTTYSKQSDVPCTASASGGKGGDIQARVTVTEVKKTPGIMTGSGEATKYTFQIEDIQFFVFKESITEIKGMDAITNAANERLMHGGGVAYYISKAAGKKMDQDCNNFIAKYGPLQVTHNFVSVPGDMKCKGIIHAVGPTWYDYKDKREECAKDLYETIKNILITAASKKWQKVALSAISSGLFGVPKKLCAEMYMKAFVDFATATGGTVKEVYFIDVSREILDLVIDAHKIWLEDGNKLDFKNAIEYTSVVSKNQTRKGAGTEKQESLIQFLGTDTTSYRETRHKYRVCKRLDVFVYQGSLTRLEVVDAIALAISPDSSKHMGVLECSVRNLAGYNYATEVDRYRNGKNGTVFVSSVTGKLRCNNIVHIITTPVKRLDKASLSFICDVYGLALTNNYKSKIRYLGMPLFGTGGAYNIADIQTLCYSVIQMLVSVCSNSSKPLQIKELHLVNLDPDINSRLQVEFTRLSRGTNEVEKSKNYTRTTQHTSSSSKPYDEDHSWIRHTPLETSHSTKTESAADGNGNSKETHGKSFTRKSAPNDAKCVYCDKKASIMIMECSHMFCTTCEVVMKNSNICLKCSTESKENTVNSNKADDTCPICFDSLKKSEELPCSHKLCKSCYQKVKSHKPQCPVCQHIFGDVTGNQPDGDMFYRHVTWKSLPGYEGCGTFEICYMIPSGKQKECHPHPGKPYKGIERWAYLPDTKEGSQILYLLKRAFDRKLVFTIGESRTTGKEDVVTWNDIHHKTKPTGGPEKFGYPDQTYLARVREELAAKGVTE
ncbi:uncharacterized protein LOC128552933 [Mercenaria mercenaria]|uniref:uncharacterized protein LOC128552933 n=1 Tax=Mercenaria mercenaria TaxID=6596 RepID=UPI00234E9ED1|nr:uncharacterized protein LOC128552933 [Mercenaria mercenaria]